MIRGWFDWLVLVPVLVLVRQHAVDWTNLVGVGITFQELENYIQQVVLWFPSCNPTLLTMPPPPPVLVRVVMQTCATAVALACGLLMHRDVRMNAYTLEASIDFESMLHEPCYNA
jgi:hypothetical protein